ncbi:adhesin [Actinoplanes sp. NPDC049265]|uniref:adhesin n=1 Tax=Actinoplanes sp. NPDC049265 TaxID=3363902 RepID=UPI003717660E
MRSTVGPLSPAVYWRRRVVVLGALLLVGILLFVSCGGNDADTKRGAGKGTSGSQAPTPAPDDSDSAEPEPSFGDDKPNEPALPDPDQLQSGTPAVPNPSSGNGTGTNNNVDAPTNGSCADQAIALTPLPAATTVKSGTPLTIRIKIRNTSPTACTRDLGAGAQELYLDQGAHKFWSSDTCSADRSTNPTKMQPGMDYHFSITWNGHQANKCSAALPTGPALPPGQYQLRARLDRKISEPVAVTVTA